jgi:tetratricopeptide (TPR) repeat protein
VASLTALSLHPGGPQKIYAARGDDRMELNGQGLLPLEPAEDDSEAYFSLAEAAEAAKLYAEATVLYQRCLALDPTEPLPRGEDDRLDAAARRAPEHPEIAWRLAKRDFDSENYSQAIESLEQVLARNPFFAPGYKLLAQVCKKAERPFPASRINGDALFACTENPGTLVEIASALIAEHKTVDAIAALSVVIVLEPNNFRANHMLARLLLNEGRWSQA